jgi:hypothetical protein
MALSVLLSIGNGIVRIDGEGDDHKATDDGEGDKEGDQYEEESEGGER